MSGPSPRAVQKELTKVNEVVVCLSTQARPGNRLAARGETGWTARAEKEAGSRLGVWSLVTRHSSPYILPVGRFHISTDDQTLVQAQMSQSPATAGV